MRDKGRIDHNPLCFGPWLRFGVAGRAWCWGEGKQDLEERRDPGTFPFLDRRTCGLGRRPDQQRAKGVEQVVLIPSLAGEGVVEMDPFPLRSGSGGARHCAAVWGGRSWFSLPFPLFGLVWFLCDPSRPDRGSGAVCLSLAGVSLKQRAGT